MHSKARSAVAPLYLFACLVLGGSAQGIWQNMVLQFAGLLIIGWAAVAKAEEPIPRAAKLLLLLAIAAIAFIALQAVPLPSTVWVHGPRARIAEGYYVLGRAVPALPISLTPYASEAALLRLIPPLAIFCAIVRLKAYRPTWLMIALLAGAIAGVLLGIIQVAKGPASPWYFYPETNTGLGVGFFANANHMADLLVMSLAFVGGLAAGRRSFLPSLMLTIVAIVLLVGIVLTDSLAGYALTVPVLLAASLLVFPRIGHARRALVGLTLLFLAASVVALSFSSISGTTIAHEATSSAQSRHEILATTGKAIADFMPFGSGLGSFVKVYRLYESPDSVTGEYVIHAHNDYAELALELGVPGILLILLFLAWWVMAARDVWLRGRGGPLVRAASIASAAALIHSLVDFPLRTAAIGACFAMCLALLASRREPRRQEQGDLRPTRHLVIG